MKLKHRKLILIISMSAMGIGLITFSIAGNKEKKEEGKETIASNQVVITEAAVETPTPEIVTETATPTPETPEAAPEVTVTEEPTEEETPTPTVTEEPTPVVEVSALEQNAHPEVNKLIKSFLQAKIDGQAKKMKKLVTDPSYIDVDAIQKKTEFIEAYDNIKVYTKKGTGDIDYIAYVYMEVKIASIDTKAPGMNEFYIKKSGDDYKIVQGKISDETAKFIQEARQSEDVQELLDKVNKKLQKAVKKDKQLAEFCKKLDGKGKESKKSSKSNKTAKKSKSAKNNKSAKSNKKSK